MAQKTAELLRGHGINPSAQRVAIAEYVLHTKQHPSAEEVWKRVQKKFPMVSRATVYNTLNLFVTMGLVRQHALPKGTVVFDQNLVPHHHFIDEVTGTIHDVPWDALEVSKIEALRGFSVKEYRVVMRGRKGAGRKRRS